MSINRWGVRGWYGRVEYESKGRFVMYDDHVEVVASLEARVTELECERDDYRSVRDLARDEVYRLREALRGIRDIYDMYRDSPPSGMDALADDLVDIVRAALAAEGTKPAGRPTDGRCDRCGEAGPGHPAHDIQDSSVWRIAGDHLEHRCDGVDPNAGHPGTATFYEGRHPFAAEKGEGHG